LIITAERAGAKPGILRAQIVAQCAAALADQLSARFTDRQHRTRIERYADTALVQIGSQHGTPVTVHIVDTEGGVLVTMSHSDALFCQACGTRLVTG